MAKPNPRSVEELIAAGAWAAARELITRDLSADPDNHWLLTQLGVTLYEQRRYADALAPLWKSLGIVPDCPLTRWNLAGALDAVGNPGLAARIYAGLLASTTSPDDDPCWESREWADALKTDCVFRLGVCYRHLGRTSRALECFHQYAGLLGLGRPGTYPIADVAEHIAALGGDAGGKVEKRVKDAIGSTFRAVGLKPVIVRGHRAQRQLFGDIGRALEGLAPAGGPV